MVPIQVIVLLLVVLSFAQGPEAGGAGAAAGLGGVSVWMELATILGTHVGLALVVWQRSRAAVRMLHNSGVSATEVSVRVDRVMNAARWGTIALAVVQVWWLGWGDRVVQWRGQTMLLKYVPFLVQAILLFPALATWALCWASYYTVERAIGERSMPYRLAAGLPTHEMPGCGPFVWMQLRHSCYLLVPIALATALESVGTGLSAYWPPAGMVVLVVTMPVLLMCTPTLVTRLWDTVPLRGPLRERLEALAQEHRLRYRDILIWKTHHMVMNAGFFGMVPWGRYLLLTDALLESLDDRQIEAVFAHEVGHGVHHHTWWYAGAIGGYLALAVGLAALLGRLLPPDQVLLGRTITQEEMAAGLVLVLVGVIVGLGFSAISRRFEHQADWFAARHMAGALARAGEAATVPLDSFLGPGVSQLETMTLEEYAAGGVGAEAAGSGSSSAAGATGAPAVGVPAEPPVPLAPVRAASAETAEVAGGKTGPYLRLGAEVFCNALEGLVELTHRSRTKGGWMHPSLVRRVALLRRLASDAEAARGFEKRMILVRVAIVVVIAGGVAAVVLPEVLQWWGK
jgi:STE24 endopeptidase